MTTFTVRASGYRCIRRACTSLALFARQIQVVFGLPRAEPESHRDGRDNHAFEQVETFRQRVTLAAGRDQHCPSALHSAGGGAELQSALRLQYSVQWPVLHDLPVSRFVKCSRINSRLRIGLAYFFCCVPGRDLWPCQFPRHHRCRQWLNNYSTSNNL